VNTTRRVRWVSTVLGATAAVISASVLALAFADIPSADGTISACLGKTPRTIGGGGGQVVDRKGTLRTIDVAAGETCQADEQLLVFNQTGPEGPQGIPGTPGADAVTHFAVVRADGTIFMSSGPIEPIGTEHGNTGHYMINFGFDKDLSGCVAVANTSVLDVPPGGIPIIPHTSVVGRASQYQFTVTMFNLATGLAADTEFTLVVTC